MSRLFAVKGQDKDAPDSSHCFIANILTQVSNHKSEDENFHITFKMIGNHKNFVDKKDLNIVRTGHMENQDVFNQDKGCLLIGRLGS